MPSLLVAELRASWRSWVAVSIAFLATNFALVLPALMFDALRHGVTDEGTLWLPIINMVFVVLVGIYVLANATQLVVSARRPAIARLALSGATPRQIIGSIIIQIVAVTVVTGVFAAILALLAQPSALYFLTLDRAREGAQMVAPSYSIRPMIGAIALTTVVAIIAGLRVAVRATRIPAVEALRQSTEVQAPRRRAGRWIVFIALILLLIGSAAGSFYGFAQNEYQKGDQVLQATFTILVLGVMIASVGLPLYLHSLMRIWMSVSKNPAWYIAANAAVARPRLSKSVQPVMMAMALLIGSLIMGRTLEVWVQATSGSQPVGTGVLTMMTLMGLPILVAISGVIGNLVTVARQRDAESALIAIAGATPRQRRAVLACEGVITAATGVLLALIVVLVASGYLWFGLYYYLRMSFVSVPIVSTVAVIVVFVVVCVASTVLPSVKSLQDPPQQVVARLIAD